MRLDSLSDSAAMEKINSRLGGPFPPEPTRTKFATLRRKFEGPSTRRESIFSDTLRTLKQSRGNRSKEKAADVSHISDASALHIRHGADLTEQLSDDPESDLEGRRDKSDSDEPAKN